MRPNYAISAGVGEKQMTLFTRSSVQSGEVVPRLIVCLVCLGLGERSSGFGSTSFSITSWLNAVSV